jgi:tetratricopeptide (TPR) repeat protein
LSQAREELLLSGLVDAESRVLATEMAQDWLKAHPAERVPLLMKLVRSTPPEEAFALYRSIYQETKGFGGIGDLQKARKAYYLEAKTRMDAKEFVATIETLSELREVEKLYEGEPDAQCRFLEAYALERLGRYKEAFQLLQALPEEQHTPDITAVQSVLFWRLGKPNEARAAAEAVIQNGVEWLWARAIATNNLGNLALSNSEFLEAASHFKKSAALFHAAGAKDRWVGSLNNYAVALDKMIEDKAKKGASADVLRAMTLDAERAYHEALEALDQTGENPLLRARIFLNLGVLWVQHKDWERAEAFYLKAVPFSEKANALDLAARLQMNLGHACLEQKRYNEAKMYFHKTIDLAARAGESRIQGMAVCHLAIIDDDADAMEVGIELLRQSGHEDHLDAFLKDYKTILRHLIEKARSQNDGMKEHLFSKKLAALQEQKQEESMDFKVETTLISQRKPTGVN